MKRLMHAQVTIDSGSRREAARCPQGQGFAGGTFDGRYVYFAPNTFGVSLGSGYLVAGRYDTMGPFGSSASWVTFSIVYGTPTAQYWGAVFDGRFVYFIPQEGAQLAQYDTTVWT
jgi:hypothetical protein